MMSAGFVVDRLHVEDAPSLQALAESVGWRFSSAQVLAFLRSGDFYGHRWKTKVVSSAGLFPYGHNMSAIGIVMVDPEVQRRGLGRELMEMCLRSSSAGQALVLIATDMGFPLYRRLGFETVMTVHRMVKELPNAERRGQSSGRAESLAVSNSAARGRNVITLTARRLESVSAEVLKLDAAVVGANREVVYRALWASEKAQMLPPRDKWVAEALPWQEDCWGALAYDGNELVGFALCFQRGNTLFIGSVLAFEPDVALAVVRHVEAHADRPGVERLRLDVPSPQVAFVSELQAGGYVEERWSPFMAYGTANWSGYRSRVFGLLDPAFG